jgi:hypothetical protein
VNKYSTTSISNQNPIKLILLKNFRVEAVGKKKKKKIKKSNNQRNQKIIIKIKKAKKS